MGLVYCADRLLFVGCLLLCFVEGWVLLYKEFVLFVVVMFAFVHFIVVVVLL